MEGWIKLHRKSTENPLYFSEPFTRFQAWIDMLIIANHKAGFFFKRGIKVNVKRGQIGYDVASLAVRWKWSRGKVERFFCTLENDTQIVRQKNNITTLISIVKYDQYQQGSNADDNANDNASSNANGHQTVKQTDTNKNDKNDKNEKKPLEEIFLNKVPAEWKGIVSDWMIYKSELGEKYKSKQSLVAMLKKLNEMSGGIPENAKLIIENSMASNYKGLVMPKSAMKISEYKPEVNQTLKLGSCR